MCLSGKLKHPRGSAVRRYNGHLERNLKFAEDVCRFLHDGQIRVGAHYYGYHGLVIGGLVIGILVIGGLVIGLLVD